MTQSPAALIGDFAIWYLAFLVSLTLHEYGHALAAYRGGDKTAYHGGQLTLDPLPHIRRSPFGMVLVPVLTFFYSGWMMGWASAPYDPVWASRNPGRAALMSAAGPIANFTLALLSLIAIRMLLSAGVFVPPQALNFSHLVGLPAGHEPGSPLRALAMLLSVMLNLNVLLGLFNLIPLPPLDGAGIVEGAAPSRARRFYAMLSGSPMAQIFGLLIAWKVFSLISGPAFSLIVKLVHPDIAYS